MPDIDHKERKHALMSPSGAARWMTCPGSVDLEQSFPDTSSSAADEGTLAHDFCEIKLRRDIKKDIAKGAATRQLNKLRKDPLYQDEMEDYTDQYVDWIREIMDAYDEDPHIDIEVPLDLSSWIPDGFGTADCVLIGKKSGETELTVIDFKYGKGVPVSAEDDTTRHGGNRQLSIYALGAGKRYSLLFDIKTVTLAIIQPRTDSHVKSFTFSVDMLDAFGLDVHKAAVLAVTPEGRQTFRPSEAACRFCKARNTCKARADRAVLLAFGDPEHGIPPIIDTTPDPRLITPADLRKYIEAGELAAKWVKDAKEYALTLCKNGEDVPGYKLVEGRKPPRAFTDQDEAFKAVVASGIPEEMLYNRVPLSLANVEKLMGKKAFQEVCSKYVSQGSGKPTLAKAEDKREAISVKPTAEEAFQ